MLDELKGLRTGEVARQLGVDRSTIQRLMRSGGITPLYMTPGGHPRYSPETVAELAERLTIEPQAVIAPARRLRVARQEACRRRAMEAR